jgi:hypothetical protein
MASTLTPAGGAVMVRVVVVVVVMALRLALIFFGLGVVGLTTAAELISSVHK